MKKKDLERRLEALKNDPQAVLVGMRRGFIAKLTVRSFIESHGNWKFNSDDLQLLEIARLREELATLRATQQVRGLSTIANAHEFAGRPAPTAEDEARLSATLDRIFKQEGDN